MLHSVGLGEVAVEGKGVKEYLVTLVLYLSPLARLSYVSQCSRCGLQESPGQVLCGHTMNWAGGESMYIERRNI